jgi:hypothetical protein
MISFLPGGVHHGRQIGKSGTQFPRRILLPSDGSWAA